MFHVAAHEAGHAIGLDHSNQPSALMYPSYHIDNSFDPDLTKPLDASYTLPQDDTRGAQYLYGRRTGPVPTVTVTTDPMPTESTADCSWSSWTSYGS